MRINCWHFVQQQKQQINKSTHNLTILIHNIKKSAVKTIRVYEINSVVLTFQIHFLVKLPSQQQIKTVVEIS